MRAYFRWLCTRDVKSLIALDPEIDHEEAVLKALTKIANEDGNGSRLYSELYAEMCRYVNLQSFAASLITCMKLHNSNHPPAGLASACCLKRGQAIARLFDCNSI